MYKKAILSATLVVSALMTDAQNKDIEKLLVDSEWREGLVILTDGRQLEGFVKYNPQVGVLSFKYSDARESKTYTANTVSSFELFDPMVNIPRTYISLLFSEKKSDNEQPAFFEILLQLRSFAVLSRMEPIAIKESAAPVGGSPTAHIMIEEFAQQRETIFFADDRGNFSPYMRIKRRTDRRKPRIEFVDGSLIPMFTGSHYEELLKFSFKHDLDFTKKEDLIAILEYYAFLLDEGQ